MVGHGFQFEYVVSGFLADFSYYLFESFVHGSGVSVDWRIVEFRVEAGYHLSPVFRTPHDVVVASVGHVVVLCFTLSIFPMSAIIWQSRHISR